MLRRAAPPQRQMHAVTRTRTPALAAHANRRVAGDAVSGETWSRAADVRRRAGERRQAARRLWTCLHHRLQDIERQPNVSKVGGEVAGAAVLDEALERHLHRLELGELKDAQRPPPACVERNAEA